MTRFGLRAAALSGVALSVLLAAGGSAHAAAFNGNPLVTDGNFTFNRLTPGEDTVTQTSDGGGEPPLAVIQWQSSSPAGAGPFTFLAAGAQVLFRRVDGDPLEVLNRIRLSVNPDVRVLIDGSIYAQTTLNGITTAVGRLVFETNAAGLDFGANAFVRASDLVLRGQNGNPLSVNWQGVLNASSFSASSPGGGAGLNLQFANVRATSGSMNGDAESRLFMLNSSLSMDTAFTLGLGAIYMSNSTLSYGGTVTTGSMTLAQNISIDTSAFSYIGVGGQRTLTLTGQLNGSFNKIGSGRVVLAGSDSQFGGSVIAQDGDLRVSGNYVRTTVAANGAFASVSGTGTVNGLAASLGAAIAPGNDGVGTLNVIANAQFGQGGIFRVDVQGGTADRLNVGGTAQLSNGPTLQINGLGGNYLINTPYVLLQANGGVSGTFTTVTGLNGFSAIYNPQIIYTQTQIQLLLSINELLDLLGPADGSENQIATLGMIDDAVADGYDPSGLAALYALAPADMLDAADQLSGEAYATASRVALDDERLVREAVVGRLSSATGNGAGVWADVHGSWGDGDGDGNAAAYDRDLTGFVAGVDTGKSWREGGWRVGLVAQYGTSDLTIDDRGSSAKIKRTGVGLYGGVTAGGLSIRVGGIYSQLDLDVDRAIVFDGFSETATGQADGTSVQGFGEIAYRFDLSKNSALEPFAQFSIVSVDFDALNEAGGDAALFVDEQSNQLLTSTIGLRAQAAVDMGGGKLRLSASAGARFVSGDRTVAALIALDGAPDSAASISAASLDSTAFSGSVEAAFDFSETGSLSVGYSGVFGDSGADHALRAGVAFRF